MFDRIKARLETNNKCNKLTVDLSVLFLVFCVCLAYLVIDSFHVLSHPPHVRLMSNRIEAQFDLESIYHELTFVNLCNFVIVVILLLIL